MNTQRTWQLLGTDGRAYASGTPGTLGGHWLGRIYGRLDCRAARQAIERGGYVRYRVFFADEATAIAAGYRPCAVCLPQTYAAWRNEPLPRNAGQSRPRRSAAVHRDGVTP
jgi:hypothetical protein